MAGQHFCSGTRVAVAMCQCAKLLQTLCKCRGKALLAADVRHEKNVPGGMNLVAAVSAPQLLYLTMADGTQILDFFCRAEHIPRLTLFVIKLRMKLLL